MKNTSVIPSDLHVSNLCEFGYRLCSSVTRALTRILCVPPIILGLNIFHSFEESVFNLTPPPPTPEKYSISSLNFICIHNTISVSF